MTSQCNRILRNYRNVAPTKFHSFNQRVKTALAEKARFPDSMWTADATLLPSYFSASDKHDATYHEALLGSRLVIAERGLLQAQLVVYLDEIASLLEMAAVRVPEILVASGFDVVKERGRR